MRLTATHVSDKYLLCNGVSHLDGTVTFTALVRLPSNPPNDLFSIGDDLNGILAVAKMVTERKKNSRPVVLAKIVARSDSEINNPLLALVSQTQVGFKYVSPEGVSWDGQAVRPSKALLDKAIEALRCDAGLDRTSATDRVSLQSKDKKRQGGTLEVKEKSKQLKVLHTKPKVAAVSLSTGNTLSYDGPDCEFLSDVPPASDQFSHVLPIQQRSKRQLAKLADEDLCSAIKRAGLYAPKTKAQKQALLYDYFNDTASSQQITSENPSSEERGKPEGTDKRAHKRFVMDRTESNTTFPPSIVRDSRSGKHMPEEEDLTLQGGQQYASFEGRGCKEDSASLNMSSFEATDIDMTSTASGYSSFGKGQHNMAIPPSTHYSGKGNTKREWADEGRGAGFRDEQWTSTQYTGEGNGKDPNCGYPPLVSEWSGGYGGRGSGMYSHGSIYSGPERMRTAGDGESR